MMKELEDHCIKSWLATVADRAALGYARENARRTLQGFGVVRVREALA